MARFPHLSHQPSLVASANISHTRLQYAAILKLTVFHITVVLQNKNLCIELDVSSELKKKICLNFRETIKFFCDIKIRWQRLTKIPSSRILFFLLKFKRNKFHLLYQFVQIIIFEQVTTLFENILKCRPFEVILALCHFLWRCLSQRSSC